MSQMGSSNHDQNLLFLCVCVRVCVCVVAELSDSLQPPGLQRARLLCPWDSPGFPGGTDSKESACNVGDLGWIPGLGRSPGEGNGNPLQYSCLGNPINRRA